MGIDFNKRTGTVFTATNPNIYVGMGAYVILGLKPCMDYLRSFNQ